MKVLVVTPYLPSPPNTGGRRRMHELIARLSRAHDVSVVSFVDPSGEAAAVEATGQIAARVVTVPNGASKATGVAKRLLQLRSMFSGDSVARLVYRTTAMQAAIDELAREVRFDLILVEFAHMAGYTFPSSAPVVLDEHNIEYDILLRTSQHERGLVRRAFSHLEYLKLRSEEPLAWSRADGCIFTSDRDRDMAIAAGCDAPVAVVPNGVDVTEFVPRPAPTGSEIVFVGADFYPNADALRFYADQVLPAVRRNVPAARLVVVGGAASVLRDRSRAGVELVGVVDDVRAYLARAAVVIAPLRIGGGTRLKILEAMAMARPVVATSIGAEGIDAVAGRDILIADDALGLARETARLLTDPDLARSVGQAGRELVERRYDWDVVAGDLRRFTRTLLAPRRAYRLVLGRERAS